MELVVYTAIFGKIRDRLQTPGWSVERCAEAGCSVRYVAFVDGVEQPTTDKTGWELRPAVWEHPNNPRLRARRHKLLPQQLFPEADCTLWIDGCLTPLDNPCQLVEDYLGKTDLCVFKHMQRRCIYAEATACIELRKDRAEIINEVVARYRREGYPENNGMAETTAVLRRHTPRMALLNNLWWHELRSFSVRDQLSLDYLCWRYDVKYSTFLGKRVDSPHFGYRAHR